MKSYKWPDTGRILPIKGMQNEKYALYSGDERWDGIPSLEEVMLARAAFQGFSASETEVNPAVTEAGQFTDSGPYNTYI